MDERQETELSMTAKQAAAELGVRVETLYSYVSRGLIRSMPGAGRARLYSAEDVRAFRSKEQSAIGRDALGAGYDAGTSGDAVRSGLTSIDAEGPRYCGRLATELAQHGSLEMTATLLWQCGTADPFARPAPQRPLASAPSQLRPVERAMVMVSAWPLVDRSAYAHHPAILWGHGVDLCRLVAAELVHSPPSSLPIAYHIAQCWGVNDEAGRDLIGMALVLSADHELNSSAYAVRVAASTGAPLHAALVAGMGAFLGPKHGAASERVDHWLASLEAVGIDALERMLEERLMRADPLPGFGHMLYKDIDPRARCLLQALRLYAPDHEAVVRADAIIDHAKRLYGLAPNIDFALAVLKRVLDLPEGAGMTLFCSGRMVGWIGHALEQFQSGRQIRPRAVYVGPKGL